MRALDDLRRNPNSDTGVFAWTVRLALGVLVFTVPARGQRVIYVNASAEGKNDGRSWFDAYADLQHALDDARASGDFDAQIWIAAGTYQPDRGTRDRRIAFELFGNIGLHGGFGGEEECLAERDPAANASILTGDLLGDDDLEAPPDSDCCIPSYYPDPPGTCTNPVCRALVLNRLPSCATRWTQSCTGIAVDSCCELCRPTRCDNAQNVIRTVEPNSVPRLDGLTITAGEAVSTPGEPLAYAGAGISSSESSPTLSHCVFTNHRGSHGAAFHSWLGSPLLQDCEFSHNLDLAVSIQEPENPVEIRRCVFFANVAGGLDLWLAGAMISSCVFRENSPGLAVSFSSVDVVDSLFVGNRGLGVNVGSSGYARVHGSLFEGNEGGGLESIGLVEVVNSVFSGNRASFGAAIDSGGILFVLNSTIVGNSASGSVGGIWAGGPSMIQNSILWGNRNIEGAEAEGAQLLWLDATPVLRNNIVQAWTGLWGGVGNSGLDPLFVDPDGADDVIGTEDDDLRLSPDSPAIDAGDPNYVPFPGETELDGHARVLCEGVDIGAYEFGIGDYDCNRIVDLTDFANWRTCMTGPSTADTAAAHNRVATAPRSDSPGSDLQSEIGNWKSAIPCQAFDFNADGSIDLFDFAAFQPLVANH